MNAPKRKVVAVEKMLTQKPTFRIILECGHILIARQQHTPPKGFRFCEYCYHETTEEEPAP